MCLNGCFPYPFIRRPEVKGIVVNAVSGAPVADAKVAIYAVDSSTRPSMVASTPGVTATTDKSGRFILPEKRVWGIYIIPMDIAVWRWSVVVRRAGYQQYSFTFFDLAYDAGQIKLMPELQR
jgi:hypothetical protein